MAQGPLTGFMQGLARATASDEGSNKEKKNEGMNLGCPSLIPFHHSFLMPVPILDMLRPCHIIHAANRAGSGLITAAAFAVHGAYISGSVFFASLMGFAGRGIGIALMGVRLAAIFMGM